MRPQTALRLALAALVLVPLGLTAADAQPSRRVEVVEVRGIIDAAVEGAIADGLAAARRDDAEVLILQVDSPGALGVERTRRLVRALLDTDVPVVTWVGPPGARAESSAAALVLAGHLRAMAPGSALGPVKTRDLRAPGDPAEILALLKHIASDRGIFTENVEGISGSPVSADEAEDAGLVDELALQIPDLLRELDGTEIDTSAGTTTLRTDPDDLSVRFRKPDLLGRLLHAVGKPNIAYLLLLLGLVGVVFELFHPSTGPAGAAGLLGLGLGLYGIATLGGSPLGVALIALGVAGFAVDLRLESLGVFTAAGFAGLLAGSLLLFGGPWLHLNPWIVAVGVGGMTAFLLGAMTRVLRDLRAIARGELEVRDPHPHPGEEQDGGNRDGKGETDDAS